MSDVRELHGRALASFGRLVHAVRPEQWGAPTPCRDWDVRALVNHLVVEQLWVPEMLAGRTVAEVGDRFDGDQLGDDPVAAWDRAVEGVLAAVAEPGALTRTVHLSYGDVPAEHYCAEMTWDATVHSWDLARAIGADDRLDPSLVEFALSVVEAQAAQLAASGLFDPPIDVPADADQQTRLLALVGRRA
ncbi:MAG TPA: TIGR03086 family metal-binding protein [Acidimicrobiales bacterium]